MKFIFKKYLYSIIALIYLSHALQAQASIIEGTIDSTNYTAQVCEDAACTVTATSGVNFGHFTSTASAYNVVITDTELRGFIWGKSFGFAVLNCLDTTSGCITLNDNFKVANTPLGQLSGYAWGSTTGWINFGPFLNTATSSVTINSNGELNGYAWSMNHGWIKFDCSDPDFCVQTDWRPQNVRPQCSDGTDNDADGLIDENDGGCHTDGNASNAGSYDPTDDLELNRRGGGGGAAPVICLDHAATNYGIFGICIFPDPTYPPPVLPPYIQYPDPGDINQSIIDQINNATHPNNPPVKTPIITPTKTPTKTPPKGTKKPTIPKVTTTPGIPPKITGPNIKDVPIVKPEPTESVNKGGIKIVEMIPQVAKPTPVFPAVSVLGFLILIYILFIILKIR